MHNFKDRVYNYESTPPNDIWDKIVSELDGNIQPLEQEEKAIQLSPFRKKSKLIFYGVTAAASLIIIFISSLFFNRNKDSHEPIASTPVYIKDSSKKQTTIDSLNNKTLENIIKSSKDKSLLGNNDHKPSAKLKKYITIAGPEGQPVKISSKVATLIVSADNDYPPNPVWDKKINKWKQIMLSSTLSPTATSLLDIVELSSMRGDN